MLLSSFGSTRHFAAYSAQGAASLHAAVLLNLGYPGTARAHFDAFLAGARRSSDPYWLGTALFLDGLHHLVLRDARTVAERADEIVSLASSYPMATNLVAASFFRGWAMAVVGRAEGIAEMRRSLSDPRLAGAMGPAMLRTVLAETYCKHARAEEGLDLTAKGLAIAEQTGLRVAEAELYRVKGELLIMKGPDNVPEAECCLRTAINVARRQSARLLELRATISLAHLMANQGRCHEARAMLTDIYNWFTEGFDIPDLKEAKALLDQLRP
jgi:predicted ATPase